MSENKLIFNPSISTISFYSRVSVMIRDTKVQLVFHSLMVAM